MAGYRNVRVEKADNGLRFHVEHPLATKADPDILAGCVQALIECAEKNGCLDGRVSLNEACLTTSARHNDETQCVARCFGCA